MRPIGRIVIDFIPQDQQRYDTCGDWLFEGDTLVLRISKTPDERHQQLVAVHELVEALACNVDGVSQEAADAFDMGPGEDLDEPGNSTDAPYHWQHRLATNIEFILADHMRVGLADYEKAVQDHGVKETNHGDEEAEG